ncbi:hypothetical protein NW759_016002 [Fusarium solani]|nr:hypothetical protein NW759_016002 [Fusarium solani]
MIASRYGAPVNLNVLPGENEHRVVKADVYTTNHSDIEKALLMKVNVRQTTRFTLIGAFSSDDPVLTDNLQDLYQCCPSIFSSILTSADDTTGITRDEIIFDIHGSADEEHINPIVMGQLRAAQMRKIRYPVSTDMPGDRYFALYVELPVLSRDMSSAFKSLLRDACDCDYHLGKLYVWGPDLSNGTSASAGPQGMNLPESSSLEAITD